MNISLKAKLDRFRELCKDFPRQMYEDAEEYELKACAGGTAPERAVRYRAAAQKLWDDAAELQTLINED